jgi:hypothetical protein
MTSYRVRGTTDDVTTCQQCGKPELKGTVILDILDEDGNTEDVIYAGTTCAAKMAGGRVAGAKIRQQATAADYRRGEIVRTAQEILAYYAPFEAASPLALGDAYAKANPGYFRNNPGADPVAVAQEAMSRRREVVATDGLSALRAA